MAHAPRRRPEAAHQPDPGPARPSTRSPARLTLVVALVVSALFAACSDGDGATPSETADPATVLTEAAGTLAAAESVAFTLAQEGGDIPIDDNGQLLFQAADGRIARPASADAILTVEALGFTTEVGAIAIDGTAWFTNPLSGEWTEAPDSFTFDPAALLDPDRGIPALLEEMAPTAQFVDAATGDESTDGGPDGSDDVDRSGWWGVEGTAGADRVGVLTGGLVSEETTVQVWVDRSTSRVTELDFELSVGDTPSTWRMTITDYDIDPVIEPPDLGDGS